MKISTYNFGSIIIDKKKFTSDIIITSNNNINSWWRQKSHLVCLDDITELLTDHPEQIIFGTGFYGLMKIGEDVKQRTEELKIALLVEKTGKAFDLYLKNRNLKKTAAAFHLTC